MKIKIFKYQKFSLFLLLVICISSCNQEQITPLPQEVVIDQISVDINKGEVHFRGTQLYGDQVGEWKILSQNEIPGSFSDTFSHDTFFIGSIYEEYRIEWSINNGHGIVTKNILFRISAGGYSIRELFEAESNISKLLELYNIDRILSSITVQEILDSGTTLNELLKLRTISQLFNSGVTVDQFLNAGLLLEELLSEISIFHLYENGTSIDSLINSGASYKEIFDGISKGISYNFCYDKPLESSFVNVFISLNISSKDLINSGIPIYDLYFYGITLEQFVVDKISFKEIILSIPTISSIDFIKLGLSSTVLMEEGIIQETPIDGFYFMNYVHHPTTGYSQNLDLINNNIQGMNSWRLATSDELTYIYENKSLFDLKLDELYSDDPRQCNEWSDNRFAKVWLGTQRDNCWGGTGGPSPSYDALNFTNGETLVFCTRYSFGYLLPVIKL